MFKKTESNGLPVRPIGQEVNKSFIVNVPVLNEKLKPKRKEIAPNTKS